MGQITPNDLQKIAELLKVKAGIEIKVMSNEFMKKGVAMLIMNDKDIEDFKEIFQPAINESVTFERWE